MWVRAMSRGASCTTVPSARADSYRAGHMSNRCWFWLVLILLACESKSAGKSVPTPTSPDVASIELKRFLDGMLVTSTVPQPDEPIWQTDSVLMHWLGK